jgi:uncharacterized protein (DUF1697 family)
VRRAVWYQARMTAYVAFLRGVSPMNAKMPELKRAFEAAGFTDVNTLLSSGNVVFAARKAAAATLQRKAEAAMEQALGRSFLTIVRSADELRVLLERDPYADARLPAGAKRVVTFLREPPKAAKALPQELDGARIVGLDGSEVFSAYVPGPKGPVFMSLIEKTFGTEVTTRTWDTVRKCVAAAGG